MWILRVLIRTILSGYNSIMLLVGILCMSLGAIFLARTTSINGFSDLSKELQLQPLACGVIILGVAMLAACVLGCLASACDFRLLAIIYMALMLAILFVTIIVSAVLYKAITQQDNEIATAVGKLWVKRPKEENSRPYYGMSAVQLLLQCCGRTGPENYANETMPVSCCPAFIKPCNKNNAYKTGCEKKLKQVLRAYSDYIGYSCLGLVLFEIFGCILAAVYAFCLF